MLTVFGSISALGEADTSRRLAKRRLLDELGGLEQDRRGDGQPEDLSGLEVEHKLELRGLLDWQIAWLRALENLVDVGGRTTVPGDPVRPVGQQPASHGE